MVLENENTENDKASSWLDTQDAELTMPKRGELRDGVIASIGSHEVLVDVGAKSEGAIPATELAELTAEEQAMLQVGNTIKVYVVNPEDRNGTIALSLLKARELSDWTLAEELSQSQQAYKGTIVGFNKGGLIVKIGQLRGFVPTSQISNGTPASCSDRTPPPSGANPSDADIMVKVVEVDQRRNRLILSERAAAKEVRESRRESLLGQLEVGQVHTR
jgi:small subunit ribosomal protein S1